MPPQAASEGTQLVIDAVVEAGEEGQGSLAAAVAEGMGQVDREVQEQQSRFDGLAATEETGVAVAFGDARQKVAQAVQSAQGQLHAAGQAQQAALDTWLGGAEGRARSVVAARQERLRQLGTAKGDEAVTAANQAGEAARGRITGFAGQARETADRRAASPGGSADAAQARSDAAREVGGNTASEITKSLDQTVGQLQGLGPETRQQIVQQATQIASQLATQVPTIVGTLSSTRDGAAAHLGQAITAGSQGLASLAVTLNQRLATLEGQIRAALVETVEQSKASVASAGQQAVQGARAQHDTTSQASAQLLSAVLAQVGSRRIRRRAAAQLASTMGGQVRIAFSSTEQQAREALAGVAQAFSAAAQQALDAVHAAAEQAGGQASSAAQGAEAEAGQQAQRLAGQFTQLAAAAIASGNGVVDGAATALDRTVADLDGRFVQSLGQFRAALDQRVTQAADHAHEPLTTLDGRIDEAMRLAEEKAHQSWLERAVSAVPWGMIAGLVVGLLVTIAVVALIGTGIGALILAGALAGALSVAASTLTDNAINHRDTDWSKLGADMLKGAIFGAIGGAVGGGMAAAVEGTVGAAVARGLIQEAAQTAVVEGLTKAGNVVVGVGMGIAQNVWEGKPWHEGLVMNMALSIGMTYGPAADAIHSASENARATAVDSGVGANVTPAEMNASSARMEARTAAVPDSAVPSIEPARPGEPSAPAATDHEAAPGSAEHGGGQEPPVPAPGGAGAEHAGVPAESAPEAAQGGEPATAEPEGSRTSETGAGSEAETGERPTTTDGREVVAEARSPETEGEVKVPAEGECEICSSPCGRVREKFQGAMEDPEVRAKVEAAEALPDPKARAKALADLLPELHEAEVRAATARSPELSEAVEDQRADQAQGDVGLTDVEPGTEHALDLPEYQQGIAEASDTFAGLPDIENPKNIANAPGGEPATSGFGGEKAGPTERVYGEGVDAGHETEPHPFDQGVEGQYESSHSERQKAEGTDQQSFASSKEMCPACQRYFGARAASQGRPQFVADPTGVHVFMPNRSHTVAPHPSGANTTMASR